MANRRVEAGYAELEALIMPMAFVGQETQGIGVAVQGVQDGAHGQSEPAGLARPGGSV